jgi:hypothetical protein
MKSTKPRKPLKYTLLLLLALASINFTGCSFTGGPRARVGYLPTATFGVNFANPDNLGTHSYGFDFFTEKGGILYTCKGGHIDIDHVRGNADNTKYLVKKIRSTLSNNKKSFAFNLTGERSKHIIRFTYPPNWPNTPDKQNIIDQIALDTAPYIAFNATVWHETQTWFGVHFAIFEPEFNSAFSWEDTYSNLLGTIVAVEALKDTSQSFNNAVTIAFNRKLAELDVQPRSVAIKASDKVRNQWYSGNFIPDMKMRNFDIGLDGSVTPHLIQGLHACQNSQILPLPMHSLKTLEHHGFTITHQIKPNVFEQGAIYKAAGSKKIYVKKHYPILIKYMKTQAAQKNYNYTD